MLLFTLALAVVTGSCSAVSGACRRRGRTSPASMKEGSARRRHRARAAQGLRTALVVTEVALASCCSPAPDCCIRSFFRLQKVDTGFDSTNVTHGPADLRQAASRSECS